MNKGCSARRRSRSTANRWPIHSAMVVGSASIRRRRRSRRQPWRPSRRSRRKRRPSRSRDWNSCVSTRKLATRRPRTEHRRPPRSKRIDFRTPPLPVGRQAGAVSFRVREFLPRRSEPEAGGEPRVQMISSVGMEGAASNCFTSSMAARQVTCSRAGFAGFDSWKRADIFPSSPLIRSWLPRGPRRGRESPVLRLSSGRRRDRKCRRSCFRPCPEWESSRCDTY